MSLTDNLPANKRYRGNFHEIDYKIKLRNHFVEHFCPADPYLEVVKDKFVHFTTIGDSLFHNVMRMSHVGKGKLNPGGNNNGSYSNVSKDNPFLRKNLLSFST